MKRRRTGVCRGVKTPGRLDKYAIFTQSTVGGFPRFISIRSVAGNILWGNAFKERGEHAMSDDNGYFGGYSGRTTGPMGLPGSIGEAWGASDARRDRAAANSTRSAVTSAPSGVLCSSASWVSLCCAGLEDSSAK